MTESEILRIERELYVKLPQEYIKVMREYSDLHIQPYESCTLSDDIGLIIGMNKGFRNGEFGGADWPLNHFTFGHDGAGNHYFLDLNLAQSPVYIKDHETHEIGIEAPDFNTWISQLQNQ